MLSISSSPPVAWSPIPAPSVAPVSAAVAVMPVQSAQRDAQTGMGQSGRHPAAAGPVARAAVADAPSAGEGEKAQANPPDAAPLLPRPQSDDARDGQAQTPELQSARAEAEREQQQAREAQEKALKEQLQDVIANVWKASAAVVEQALGRDSGSADAVSAADLEAVTATSAVAPLSAEGSVAANLLPQHAPAANDDGVELAGLRAQQEVVAYDAQGYSSLAPLEAGTLISQRV